MPGGAPTSKKWGIIENMCCAHVSLNLTFLGHLAPDGSGYKK